MATAFFTDTRFAEHTLIGHPEHAGRLIAIQNRLEESGILAEVNRVLPREATREELLRVHAADYLDLLDWTAARESVVGLDADTYVLPASYQLARIAAGGLLNVVDAVLEKRAGNGFAAIRPPGHHATPIRGMGFCLLNNVAIAARYAQDKVGFKRVAIVDFDVHHGNGTQDTFYDDPSVYFVSSHQSPLYPGTGSLNETGSGTARGSIMNLPLPNGTGDSGFETLYQKVVFPALLRFQPEMIFVSAGFDAHWRDPLAGLGVSLTMFANLTRWLIQSAEALCEGRIVFVTEGGYDLEVLSYAALNVIHALLGQDTIHDPLGKAARELPLADELVGRILKLHELG